jgi:hypothetical protein
VRNRVHAERVLRIADAISFENPSAVCDCPVLIRLEPSFTLTRRVSETGTPMLWPGAPTGFDAF